MIDLLFFFRLAPFKERGERASRLDLLEVHPELDIGPLLIDAGAQVLLDISAGEQMAIGRLEGQLAVHKHVRPGEVDFVADVRLGVPYLGTDIDALGATIPVVLRTGQVQVGVPDFNVVILGWTDLEVDRGTHHVLPGLDVHVAHVDVVGREHVLKRVGSLTVAKPIAVQFARPSPEA